MKTRFHYQHGFETDNTVEARDQMENMPKQRLVLAFVDVYYDEHNSVVICDSMLDILGV